MERKVDKTPTRKQRSSVPNKILGYTINENINVGNKIFDVETKKKIESESKLEMEEKQKKIDEEKQKKIDEEKKIQAQKEKEKKAIETKRKFFDKSNKEILLNLMRYKLLFKLDFFLMNFSNQIFSN